MSEQAVKGETAIKKMLKRALGQEHEVPDDSGEKPLERAQKVTEQIIANQMIESQLEKSRAETAEAKAKAAKAERDIEKIEAGEDRASGSTFKVKGEVNMGTIDFQAQQREAQAELKRLTEERDKQLQSEGQVNQQLREQLHKKELDIVEIGLKAQIEESNKRLEAILQKLGNQKNFLEEYTEAIATAKQLGIYNPQAGTDATVTIELQKMEFEHQMALRKMIREEKRADREFQLTLRKWDDEREFKKEELNQKKKRDEMFASTPEFFGRMVARGLLEGGVEEGISEEAPSPKGKQPTIAAGVGESGEVECPGCHEPIAIGPTARVAVCAGCGARYPIKRTAKEPVEE